MRILFNVSLIVAFLISRPSTAQERVGVYDSRAIAYAHFWSEPVQQQRATLMASAKGAKQAGNEAEYRRIAAKLAAMQKATHLEVFSTAPADEAIGSIRDRLPAIQKELGVHRVISRWDSRAMSTVPVANRIDVTDRLVREFLPEPTAQQKNVIASMQNAKPLPLWEAKLLTLMHGI